jgi:hypothetical protein
VFVEFSASAGELQPDTGISHSTFTKHLSKVEGIAKGILSFLILPRDVTRRGGGHRWGFERSAAVERLERFEPSVDE